MQVYCVKEPLAMVLKYLIYFPFQPEGSNLKPEDPQWIGAWWLGYLGGGCLLLPIAGLLLGFPRELPGAKRIREEAQKEGQVPKKDERIQGNLKDILPATLQLLKAPVFIFNSLAVTSGSLFGAGIASFLAKILQLKFGLSSLITGAVIGAVLVPGTVGKNIAFKKYIDCCYRTRFDLIMTFS